MQAQSPCRLGRADERLGGGKRSPCFASKPLTFRVRFDEEHDVVTVPLGNEHLINLNLALSMLNYVGRKRVWSKLKVVFGAASSSR